MQADDGGQSLAGADSGLFVSTNDGLTWDDQCADEIDAEVTALAVEGTLVLMGTASDGMYVRRMSPNQRWRQLPESTLVGAICAITTVPDSDGSIRVVTIGNTDVQQYQNGLERDSPSVHLLRTDPLPRPAVTSTLFTTGATVHAAVADTRGEIVLLTIAPKDGPPPLSNRVSSPFGLTGAALSITGHDPSP